MEAAAHRLASPPTFPGPPFVVHLLTGRRFWHQTAFCLHTLATHSRRTLHPVIHDDGSMTPEVFAPLARLFPAARLVSMREIEARLDQHLPATRFPGLRERRRSFVLLRKLTDVHAGLTGWRLFIDSDLLFFHAPELLLSWHDHPDRPLRATDVENAYGYPLAMLNELAGQPVDERVNTGLLGLRSDEIDWDRMEFWCRSLIERAGPHYYQEQALVALLLAGRDAHVAPLSDYVTFPRLPEALECRAVMHHYVAESKRWYFQRNWRRATGSAVG
jgi:hypothetical protein